jgi:thiamine-phosphate diphosphorylase
MGPVLSLITDRRRLSDGATLVPLVAGAARAGVHLIQVREPDLDGRSLETLVTACLVAVQGTPARVIVNDRLDVALAAGAHGVHLREHSIPASAVRAIAPRGFCVGRSVHTVADAARVTADGGLDYLVFGPVFETVSKPRAHGVGLDELARAVRATPLPVLALGGIDESQAVAVARSGAAGAAGIGLWIHAADLRAAAQSFATAFSACRR